MYVWTPIDKNLPFDSKKANEYIDSVYGLDYGYEVMLMAWIDTEKDNYPCRSPGKCLIP